MTCGLLLMETTEDSSARYFPLSQTIGAEYVFLFAMSRTIADSLGRYYLLSRTMADKYVFHFSISNRLSDGYPGRGVLHTPLARLSSTPSPLAGRLVGRMQYAPTLSKKDKVSLGMCFLLSRTIRDKSVFLFSMFNRLSDGYPGRGVLNTPLARLSSTLSPFTGRLVGRMQYVPTLPAEKSDLKGWRGVTFRRRGDSLIMRTKKGSFFGERIGGRRYSANGSDLFCRVNHKRE